MDNKHKLTETEYCRRYTLLKFNSLPVDERMDMEDLCETFRQRLIKRGYPQIALHLSDMDLLELYIKVGSKIRETERK
jgi:hypothetical protein